jgi:glycerophosphoryl diester phosphodiesterase
VLHKNGYRGPNSPVFIQSFEVGNLMELNEMTRLPLVQLVSDTGAPYDFVVSGDPRTYADMVTPAGLTEVATYADGIGANKNLIFPRDAANNLLAQTTLIADAHAVDLIVHAWTFRAENTFLPNEFRQGNPADADYMIQFGDLIGEIQLFLDAGLDGFFTDQPDLGVEARNAIAP